HMINLVHINLVTGLVTKSQIRCCECTLYGEWCFFIFLSSRRRHTRLQGDWSSDVCSSDLRPSARRPPSPSAPRGVARAAPTRARTRPSPSPPPSLQTTPRRKRPPRAARAHVQADRSEERRVGRETKPRQWTRAVHRTSAVN